MTTAQPMPFGALLKRLRRTRGLTQEALAERAGYSPVYISMLERGARSPLASTVALLAEALQLDPEERAALEAARRSHPTVGPDASATAGTAVSQAETAHAAEDSTPTPTLTPTPPELSAEETAPPTARGSLPAGTVTFLVSSLVTDVEPATQVVPRRDPAAAAVLADHERLLRAAFAAHHGYEVEWQGDRFLVAFPVAADAVAAAAQAQRALTREAWPAGTAELQVRMGLHSGAPTLVGDHYLGLDVHRTWRIAAAGHGGQVLLSEATRVLAERELPAGASLRDLGAHRLTDLQRPEHLYQLCLDDLPATFPPLRSLDARPHNLPVQPTPLLGREREVAGVTALLRRTAGRLMTITGPGGTGKTRLGLQVAADLVDAFPDGVWFVRLSRLVDPALVLPTIAQTLDLRESGGASITALLRVYLREKSLLLLLDNFEQVADAAPLLAELLSACPGVRALVTSRVPLHLRGEQEYPLAPLPLPDPAHLPPLEQLSHYAAVTLFIERAQDVLPDFTVTNATAPAVAAICARLDGLPLAIELAAAHVKLLPPPALLQRLERRLPLLVGGARDLEARQQTMWATLAWSESLLTPAARRLFRRLSVFVGGCTLEAVEAICAAPEAAAPLGVGVLEGLGHLVDHSVAQQRPEGEEGEGGEPRVSMLQVIREYAGEQLEASGEAEALRRAHCSYYLQLAEQAEPALMGPEAASWLTRLEQEHDNLRAALGWARERDEAEVGLRLAAALENAGAHAGFWFQGGYLSEGRSWLEAMLALAEPAGPGAPARVSAALRARAHYAVGGLAGMQGDFAVAKAHMEQAAALGQAVGDRLIAAAALAVLSDVGMAIYQGDVDEAEGRLSESLALMRELGDRGEMAEVLGSLGRLAYIRGDLDKAEAAYGEAVTLARQVSEPSLLAEQLTDLGQVARRRGELDRAMALACEALVLLRGRGRRTPAAAASLECLALTLAAARQQERSARLLGAAASLRETVGYPQKPFRRQETEEAVAQARAALGAAEWAAAFAAGRSLSLEEAIAEALGEAEVEGQTAPVDASHVEL